MALVLFTEQANVLKKQDSVPGLGKPEAQKLYSMMYPGLHKIINKDTNLDSALDLQASSESPSSLRA